MSLFTTPIVSRLFHIERETNFGKTRIPRRGGFAFCKHRRTTDLRSFVIHRGHRFRSPSPMSTVGYPKLDDQFPAIQSFALFFRSGTAFFLFARSVSKSAKLRGFRSANCVGFRFVPIFPRVKKKNYNYSPTWTILFEGTNYSTYESFSLPSNSRDSRTRISEFFIATDENSAYNEFIEENVIHSKPQRFSQTINI